MLKSVALAMHFHKVRVAMLSWDSPEALGHLTASSLHQLMNVILNTLRVLGEAEWLRSDVEQRGYGWCGGAERI